MKLEFTKLITSSENIEIDFGDGRGFLPYPVNEAKAQGITIPNNIPDFNNIEYNIDDENFHFGICDIVEC